MYDKCTCVIQNLVNNFPILICSLQEDNALRFLSQEEQECLQFFEETIDSLEESLEEDDRRPLRVSPPEISYPVTEVDGPYSSSPNPVVTVSSPQDIIDLVHPEPDLVHSKEPMFNPTNPGSVQQWFL